MLSYKRKELVASLSFVLAFVLAFSVLIAANSVTRELPEDAVSPEDQVLKIQSSFGGTYMDIMKTMYNRHGTPIIIQEPLTRFDRDFNVKPAGADSWEVSDDGLTWTFHLDPDLKWSDGKDIAADDYLYALKRALRQGYDFGWYYSFAAGIKNWNAVSKGEKEMDELGVEVAGPETLKVTTSEPKPYLPGVFSWWMPVPKHVVEEHGDEYATKADTLVASGPFMVTEWIKGQKIVYEPNPHYGGEWKPYLKKIIEVGGTSEAETSFPAYMGDDLDVSSLNPGQLRYARKAIPDQLHSWPSWQIFYLSLNTNVQPFDDPKVRKALALAIDREQLTSTALEDLANPLTTILMPGYPGHHESLTDELKFNPEKAQQLLAEAGYPDGEGFPKLDLYVRDESVIMHIQKPLAQYIQNQFKKNLGININIKIVQMKTWVDYLYNLKKKFFMSPYAKDYFDPSNFLGLFTSSGREPYNNEKYNDLVNEANRTFDQEKRQKLYKQAEELFLEEVPAVPLVQKVTHKVWKPYLSGEGVEANSDGVKRWGAGVKAYNFTHTYIAEKE